MAAQIEVDDAVATLSSIFGTVDRDTLQAALTVSLYI
jgi:hypothetical protein